MFRGKESSNRIELSQFVQDLSNFGVLGYLWLWGWGGWWLGGALHTCTCTHTHAHACTYTHAHIHVKHDNFNCKWLGIPYDVIHMCVYPPTTPTHIQPPPSPVGDPRNQSKFNSTWTNQDILILFEDLKSVETHGWVYSLVGGWMGGWVDWWGQVKTLKILKMLTESR